VARAKKTDRANARRRARLATSATTAEATTAGDGAGSAPQNRVAPAAGARPGILGAFSGAIRPVNVRQDIHQIPWLITKTNSVWLPSLLVLVSAGWFASSGGALRDLPGLVFNLFVFPPPLAAAFLAGILTDRMSYLAGLLVGIVATVVFSVYVLVGPIAGASLTLAERQNYVLFAIAISPLSGLAIGAFAGFYRRFLRRANPNAGARQQTRNKAAKASARR
jgi:hypothetical protein